jgi:hypothetical protein
MQMCFDLTGVTLKSLNFIMNFTRKNQEHEIYLNDDFTVSLLIREKDSSFFKHFNFNSKDEQEKTIEIIDDEKKTIA